MNLLAIVGSPRKGKTTDILVDQAIEGFKSKDPASQVTKLYLSDYTIHYCKNCLICRDSKTNDPVARCSIRDDMDTINQYLLNSDAIIIGTPVHAGNVTALLATFLERICWVFAKPEGKILTVIGCPIPRSLKSRKGIIIVVSGIVPPFFRIFCDNATSHIKSILSDSLNTKVLGTLYAGDIEHRGIQRYTTSAYDLGITLAHKKG